MAIARLEGRLIKLGTEDWEHAIRPAVMIRKNSYQSGSDRGALTSSVLMSVLRTLRVRG